MATSQPPNHDLITKSTSPTRALPPPPSSTFHLAVDSNPPPTLPPRAPLPALPPQPSPRFDDAGFPSMPLLNLSTVNRTPSSARSSWLLHNSSSDTRSWEHIVDPSSSTASLNSSEEAVSDSVLLQTLLRQHGHSSLDEWHNRQFGQQAGPVRITESEMGHGAGGGVDPLTPEVRNILAAYQLDLGHHQTPSSYRPRSRATSKKERRASPPSASTSSSSITRMPATPVSPRNSIASDLISLSETSKSLHNLSKRLSGSFGVAPVVVDPRQSMEVFDPFEFDRFEEPRETLKSPAPSIKSRSAGSSPKDFGPSTWRSEPNRRLSTASSQYLPLPNSNFQSNTNTTVAEPIMVRPALNRSTRSGAGASQDLIQKSLDLADKRATLEARRAELLGLPPPVPKAVAPPMSPSERKTEFPPPLRRMGGTRPPKLVLQSGENSPSTASSVRSVSSTSTARPGIVLRPSTESDIGESPLRQEFDFSSRGKAAETSTMGSLTPAASHMQFSPSSMTFGGDCHRYSRVPSPPPPLPSTKRSSELPAPPLPSKTRESIPPPPPPKDSLRSIAAMSPDISQLLADRSFERSQQASSSRRASPPAGESSSSSIKVRRVADLSTSSRRLSHASSSNSLRTTPRNFSYPTDAAVDEVATELEEAEGEDDDDEEEDFRLSQYYYSHAQGKAGFGGWPEVPSCGVSVVPEEEDDGGSSDSSLDLHTPLPDMLVRAGVLSSRSALIASGSCKDKTVSEASSASKSKEEKAADLAKGAGGKVISRNRLVRHRDGKNLGLGLGLTTGLGWSDSEDEGAPSPLRRHISQVILKKSSQGSFSTLASSTSMSNFGVVSRRESILSATTEESGKSRGSNSTASGGARSLTRLRTTNLKGSQSMAQISPVARPPLQTRQTSMSVPSYGGPPSSFRSASKGTPSSQQSSISSLGSVLHPPSSFHQSGATLRSPASSSTSLSTASSSNPSPVTPFSSSQDDSTDLVGAAMSLRSGAVGLGIVDGGEKQQGRLEMRRVASSSATTAPSSRANSSASIRSRASSQAMPPPSAFSKPFPGASSSPTTPSASTPRARTISSGSQGSAIPGPRTRTTSNGSVATSGLKSKSSMASIKSVAHSVASSSAKDTSFAARHARRPSSALSVLPPPPLSVMTVGSLAFPSPPPLSPAVVNMRLAQAHASAEMRKSSLSMASRVGR